MTDWSKMPASAVRPGEDPMAAHRRAYPEQYTHPLCGKRVAVDTGTFRHEGTFERVVQSRFGPLAKVSGHEDFFSLKHIKEL